MKKMTREQWTTFWSIIGVSLGMGAVLIALVLVANIPYHNCEAKGGKLVGGYCREIGRIIP